MTASLNHRYFTLFLSRDFEAYRDVARQAAKDAPSSAYRERMAVEVLHSLAVRRFGEAPSLAEIDAFLAAPRESTIAVPIPMVDREAVLRAVLGERVVVRGMPRTAMMGATMILIVHLNEDLRLSGRALDTLVGKAERYCLDSASGAEHRI